MSVETPGSVSVRIRRLEHAQGLPLPSYGSAGSAGLDLRSAAEGALTVAPRERCIVPSGFVMEIPAGYEGQIRPRSGRAWKQGLTVVNAPGTIDSDYRGEVGVLLINLGAEEVEIKRGERIAQLVISAVPRVQWVEIDGDLDDTARGSGGFGSTGYG